MHFAIDPTVLDWLLAGDPAIRWQAPRDPRFGEAIEWLLSKRRPDGVWPLGHRYSGLNFFHLETGGQPSRWNTLRALRVLKWWNASA